MAKQLINLTLLLVTCEIETILANYPEYPYQAAFATSDSRLKLTAYVLNHIPSQYTLREENETLSIDTALTLVSSQKLLDIERWIHRGIREILNIDNTDISQLHSRDKSHFALYN